MQTLNIGWNSPCMPDSDGYFRKCSGCEKWFNNKSCYDRHIEQNICSIYKRCVECGLNYKIENKKDEFGNIRPINHYCNKKVI